MASLIPRHDPRPGDPLPGTTSRVDRRAALKALIASGAMAGVPGNWRTSPPMPLPQQEVLGTNPEKYWTDLRRDQFLLADSRVFLNNGSLGLTPRPVLQAVIDSLTRGAEYSVDQVHRWGYEKLPEERAQMAGVLGCQPDELAFTHNCTEALGFIANGLDLRAGDEVLLTNQEHASGIACWQLQEARRGIAARQVEIPLAPKQPDEITDRLISAIGPKTRVLFFSGITSPTGLILPAKQICQAAREKGVVSVLDGAHMDGQIPVNLNEIGCDYFAGSPHKWMFAPSGCGLLYGRENRLDELWPTVVSLGWDKKEEWKSARFMLIGTNNRATIDGMLAGVQFLNGLGEAAVYQRMHELARMARRMAAERHYLDVITADDSRLFQAMLSLKFKTDKLDALWAAMKANNICVLNGQQFRLSFHIHTRSADIEKFFEICDRHAST